MSAWGSGPVTLREGGFLTAHDGGYAMFWPSPIYLHKSSVRSYIPMENARQVLGVP